MHAADAMRGPWAGGRGGGFGPGRGGGFGPGRGGGFGPGRAAWAAMAAGRRAPGFFGPGPRGGFGFGGPPFGGFPGPMSGRGPKVRRGDVRAAILAVLAERPLHGYQISQEITERSGGVWRPSPGSVYPAVQQLEDEGLVRVEKQHGRRTVHLTDAGRTYVQEHQEELDAVWDTVTESVSDEVLGLGDLAAQVGAAVMQVAHAGTASQVAEAGKILADTRRSLYRILAEGEPERGDQRPAGTDSA